MCGAHQYLIREFKVSFNSFSNGMKGYEIEEIVYSMADEQEPRRVQVPDVFAVKHATTALLALLKAKWMYSTQTDKGHRHNRPIVGLSGAKAKYLNDVLRKRRAFDESGKQARGERAQWMTDFMGEHCGKSVLASIMSKEIKAIHGPKPITFVDPKLINFDSFHVEVDGVEVAEQRVLDDFIRTWSQDDDSQNSTAALKTPKSDESYATDADSQCAWMLFQVGHFNMPPYTNMNERAKAIAIAIGESLAKDSRFGLLHNGRLNLLSAATCWSMYKSLGQDSHKMRRRARYMVHDSQAVEFHGLQFDLDWLGKGYGNFSDARTRRLALIQNTDVILYLGGRQGSAEIRMLSSGVPSVAIPQCGGHAEQFYLEIVEEARGNQWDEFLADLESVEVATTPSEIAHAALRAVHSRMRVKP